MTDTILQYLFENTVVFALLFGGIWLIKKAFKRQLSSAMHYVIWAIVLVKLMLPVSFASEMSPWNLFSQPQNTPVTQQAAAQEEQIGSNTNNAANNLNIRDYNIPTITNGLNAANTTPVNSQKEPVEPIQTPIQIDWGVVILAAWLAGVCVTATWLLIGRTKISRQIRRSKQCRTPAWIYSILLECKKELNIRRKVRIIVQEALPVPAIMGAFKPVLVLPYLNTLNKNREQTRHILMHELMHFKRGDLFVIALLNALSAVYWYNPLAWLCFKLIRKDMETACDNMVVEALGQGKRQEYIHTLVQFAGKSNQCRMQAALSLNDARTQLKKRISGMFMNKKTKVTVKIPVFLIVAAMLATAFTTACQPTPDRPIIVGKQDSIEQKVTDNGQGNPLAGVPATFQDSYTQGKVTVKIDAKVEAPQVSQIPVVKVVPDRFTQDTADKVISTLMQGKPIWEPETVQTKAELQKQLVYLKAMQEKIGDKGKDKMGNAIQQTEDAMAKAPETVERTISSGKLSDINEQKPGDDKLRFKGQELEVQANLGHEYDANLYINSSESGKTASVWFTNEDNMAGAIYDSYSSTAAGTANGMKTTLADAQAKALQTAQDMGCTLKLSAVRVVSDRVSKAGSRLAGGTADPAKPAQAYIFWFTREVGGVPTTYETYDGASVDVPEGDAANFFEPYPYEQMYMIIDDTGIVELQWVSPAKVTDTVSANAKLLGFDEVMSIFKTQYFIQNALKVNGKEKQESMTPENPNATPVIVTKDYTYTEHITRVTLGMIRLPVKDNPNEYTLVPVWDFFGTEHVEYDKPITDAAGVTTTSEDLDWTGRSLLTINAIDGSIIDRSKGSGVG